MRTPDQAIAEGNALIEAGRYREAVQVIEDTARTDLTNWRLQCLYAEALIQIDRFRDGLAVARLAEQMRPSSAWVLQTIAEAQLGLEQTRDAAATATRMVEVAPNFASGYDLQGRCALKEKRFADAEIDFRRAVEIEPNNWGLNNNLGLALRHLKRDREAVQYLERAVTANPKSRIARRNLFGATSAYALAGGLVVILAAIRAVPAIGARFHIPTVPLTVFFFGALVVALIARWLWSRRRLHQLGPRVVEAYHQDWLAQTTRSTLRYLFRLIPVLAVVVGVLMLGLFGPIGFLPWIVAG
ncbi:MAG TPA: tetratricopeptide repeat protein, partial [Candidatus Dormibacteraeota bacterium]|nr:tetratricopeptide repeat protein [Candidatus Dormibacteraeota bacterium]